MIQLTRKHNEAFQAKADADFVREVMQYLRENHADTVVKLPSGEFTVADLSSETLKKMVEGGFKKASFFGFERRRNIISFIILLFIAAPNFYEIDSVNNIFRSSILLASLKFEALWVRLNDQDWAVISNNYDEGAWHL